MKSLASDVRHVRRQLAQQSLWAFAKTYLADHVKLTPAPAHHEIYALLEDIQRRRGQKVVVGAPRGFGKSTLVNLTYTLYSIAFATERFIVLLSATASQAIQILENVRKELETNAKLLADFPELTGPRPTPWTRWDLETPNRVRVLALGVGQHIRGRKFGRYRPTLVVADDVENRQSVTTSESCKKLQEWYHQDILQAGTEETCYLVLGTVPSPESLLARLLDPESSLMWIKRRYSAVLSGPAHPELWERWSRIYNGQDPYEGARGLEAAKRFYEANRSSMDEGVRVLWDERWTYHDLMIEQENDPVGFASELMCTPLNPQDCWFDLESYHYWTRRYKVVDELLRNLGEGVLFYGACDPSAGRDRLRGDCTAITVLAKAKDGVLYEIVADVGHQTVDEIVTTILAYHQRYRFQLFGFETNGFQVLIADRLEQQSRARNLYLPIKRIEHTTDKLTRIQRLQPLLKSGAIQLCEGHRHLMEELRYFPRGKRDDALDSLEMALRVAERSRVPTVMIVGGRRSGWDDEDWSTFYKTLRP